MRCIYLTAERATKIFLYISMIMFLAAASVRIGTATPATTMSVEPPSIIDETLMVGDTFSVDIVITDVSNMSGYEFKLFYDCSLLSVTNIILVNDTNFFYEHLVWNPDRVIFVTETEAYVYLVVTLPFGALEGIDGSGTVVTIDFTVYGTGETDLNLDNTFLIEIFTAEHMEHEATDGYFNNFPALRPPVANFTFSPATPLVAEIVTFNASASEDPDGTITTYHWDFGDDTTDTGKIVNHTFAAANTYTVNLTVTDNDGKTDSITADVQVIAPAVHDVAVVSVTASESSVPAGEEVSISVKVKNEGTRPATFSVTVSYDSQIGQSQTVLNLAAGSERTLTFAWDTSDLAADSYTIKAEASKVAGETDETDNTGFSDPITVEEPSKGMPDLILYGAVAAVIIVIVVVAIYLIKIRKP